MTEGTHDSRFPGAPLPLLLAIRKTSRQGEICPFPCLRLNQIISRVPHERRPANPLQKNPYFLQVAGWPLNDGDCGLAQALEDLLPQFAEHLLLNGRGHTAHQLQCDLRRIEGRDTL